MKTVITIGRQYGSGGRMIGKMLAESLGIPFYDKELITFAAEHSGLHEDVLKKVDEVPSNNFLYRFTGGYAGRVAGNVEQPLNDKVFVSMTKAIRELASESCVIVGRCGNYVLRDNPNALNVFIYGDQADRIAKVCRTEHVSEAKAKELIRKTDRARASYCRLYTDRKWGERESYDVLMNSSVLGYEGTAAALKKIVEEKEQKILENESKTSDAGEQQ